MSMQTWTKEETELLSANYNILTNSELASILPNKSRQAIYKKAYKMGFRKCHEIEFKNRSEARKREKGFNWKGGKRTTAKGYVQILAPDHPRADSAGYVMEHIFVWENATGIPVPDGCCIHHLNGKKNDNDISNLCMMQIGAHTVFHHKGKRRK